MPWVHSSSFSSYNRPNMPPQQQNFPNVSQPNTSFSETSTPPTSVPSETFGTESIKPTYHTIKTTTATGKKDFVVYQDILTSLAGKTGHQMETVFLL
jgi:hypothetical protein